LVKFSDGPTVIVGTDDATFTLCSVLPRDPFKFKCTARTLRRCTVRTVYTASAIPTAKSVCDVAMFCPQGGALVVSRPIALLREVYPESNARASKFPLMRHSTMFVLLRTVGKEEGFFTCRAKQVVSCISLG